MQVTECSLRNAVRPVIVQLQGDICRDGNARSHVAFSDEAGHAAVRTDCLN